MRDIEALTHERITNFKDLAAKHGTLLENNNINGLVLDLCPNDIFLRHTFDILKESESLSAGGTE